MEKNPRCANSLKGQSMYMTEPKGCSTVAKTPKEAQRWRMKAALIAKRFPSKVTGHSSSNPQGICFERSLGLRMVPKVVQTGAT